MNVSELKLPTNFGLDALYETNNNNAAFLLENGERFGASSLMLGLHSPVLKNKYIKEGILDIGADEFSAGAVRVFVEAMYCGNLDISTENFRDVNKICHVYDVKWMSSRCTQFFEGGFDETGAHDSDGMKRFLFDEAVYFCEQANSGSLLELWKKKTGDEKRNNFIRNYLKSASYLPEFTLETVLGLTNDHSVFLEHIRGGISETNPNLDNISRYLLLHINLVECFLDHAAVITDIFDILLENEDSADWKMLYKLYRRVTKEYLVKQSGSKVVVAESAVAVCKYQSIPNLLNIDRYKHKQEDEENYNREMNYDELKIYLENSAALSSSLYIYLELAYKLQGFYIDCYEQEQWELTSEEVYLLCREVASRKNWGPVHPDFNFQPYYREEMVDDLFLLLTECPNMRSGTGSVLLVSQESKPVWNIMTSSATYTFHLCQEQPCNKASKCGFLIEITGMSEEDPERFDVKLVLDIDKYPDNLHFHDDVCADRMHLVLEKYDEYENTWRQIDLSWAGKPSFQYDCDGELEVSWGGYSFRSDDEVLTRLVVYYRLGA